jgi:hypothetical protein
MEGQEDTHDGDCLPRRSKRVLGIVRRSYVDDYAGVFTSILK